MISEAPADRRGFMERFLDHTRRSAEKVAVRDLATGTIVSYRELRSRSERVQARLHGAGVCTEDVVGICLPTGVDFMTTYLAVLSLGARPLLLNPALGPGDMTAPLSKLDASLLITTSAVLERLEKAARLPAKIWLVDGAPESAFEALLPVGFGGTMPLRAPSGNPIAAIFFTYKGIGRPLGVAHAYSSFTAFVDVGPRSHWPQQGPGSVHLVVLPLSTVFGLGCGLYTPLAVGAEIVLPPKTRDFIPLLAEHNVQVFCFVPEVAKFLLAAAQARESSGLARPTFREDLCLLSGASWLDPKLAEACGRALGVRPIMQGYGATECLPCLSEHFESPRRAGSMGITMPSYETRVVAHDGGEAETGQLGELWVAGPCVVSAYIDDPDATRECFSGKWFRTGDLVRRDRDGFIFFAGRRRRFAKVSSYMVDLREVELAFESIAGVASASVYVQPNEAGVDSLFAEITTSTSERSQIHELDASLRVLLAGYKVPAMDRISVSESDQCPAT